MFWGVYIVIIILYVLLYCICIYIFVILEFWIVFLRLYDLLGIDDWL